MPAMLNGRGIWVPSSSITSLLLLLVARGFSLRSANDVRPGIASNDGRNTASSSTMSENDPAGSTSNNWEPEFDFIQTQNNGINITVSALPSDLSELPFFHLMSYDRSVKLCLPISSRYVTNSTGPGSALAFGYALVEQLPLSEYCVQLTCSCEKRQRCRRRPLRCLAYPHRGGVDMDAWHLSVSGEPTSDTAAGPAFSVEFRQSGHWFENLRLSHFGCADGKKMEVVVNANETYELHEHCSLAHNCTFEKKMGVVVNANEAYELHEHCSLAHNCKFEMRVEPDTWYCRESRNCLGVKVCLGPLRLLPRGSATPLRAPPTLLLKVGVPVLTLLALALAGAGLLWSRQRHRRTLADLPLAAAGGTCCDNAALAAGRPSVLLLHLARSDAEREVVRGLTAALRARGAAVTDCAAPESRRALRRDAAALLSEVPADGRVLVLASPAVSAALAAAGGAEHERLVAAAVRQLSASRLTADYGRVYQVRLSADAPTVPGLVTGAVYTLPEHQHELVTALLGAGAASDHTLITETHKGNGLAEHSV